MATIVMTGGTSGIGALAADRLIRSGARLIVGARRRAPAGVSIHLDLTSLESVRTFATSVRDLLDGTPIDALVLNAGMIRPDVAGRTVDGFETTFTVNHLAPYLSVRLLIPAVADEGTVVLTTSGTHDPATGAGLLTPRHADAELLAHPDSDPDVDQRPRKAGEHAYTASKLCTVLTARALSECPDTRSRGIAVVAYDPGQVFGTGLAKDLPLPMRAGWSLLGTSVAGWAMRRFDRNVNSRRAAGNALADLALRRVAVPGSRTYGALRRGQITWPEPSDLARSATAARALWDDSARLVGAPDRTEIHHPGTSPGPHNTQHRSTTMNDSDINGTNLQRSAVEQAIAGNWFGMLATSSAENRPHVAGVLYALVGRDLYVSTDETSRKARNIADTGRAALCIPVGAGPDAPPNTASFQGRAELLANDSAEITALVASGALAAVTSHGELDRPGTCMVKVTPTGNVATYGIGVSDEAMAADPLSAAGSVAW